MAKDMTGTVAVIGGSYVGLRLARQLAAKLPSSHKVVLLRGGEEKAFVPYSHVLQPPHSVVHSTATSIDPVKKTLRTEDGKEIRYDVLALATGTRLQSPWNVNVHGKQRGVGSLQEVQDRVQQAKRIVIVGAGAVGVQVAFDIRQLYPEKQVVVVHSRTQVMNKFHPDLHSLVTERFKKENIETVLGSRVSLPEDGYPAFEPDRTVQVQLQNGNSVEGDLVLLCTGQTPRSDLLKPFPKTTTDSGFIKVTPSLTLPNHPEIFSIGDVADTGAPKTVRAAFGQVDTATHNILAQLGLHDEAQQTFTPGPAGIHLTLGLKESVKFGNPTNPNDPPRCLIEEDGALDMNAGRMWTNLNVPQGTNWHLWVLDYM